MSKPVRADATPAENEIPWDNQASPAPWAPAVLPTHSPADVLSGDMDTAGARSSGTPAKARMSLRWTLAGTAIAAGIAALCLLAWSPAGTAAAPAAQASADPSGCVWAEPGSVVELTAGTHLVIEYTNTCAESYEGGAAIVRVLDEDGALIEDGISNLPPLDAGQTAGDEVLFQHDISQAAETKVKINSLW